MVWKPFVSFLCNSLDVELIFTEGKFCWNSFEDIKKGFPKDHLLKYVNRSILSKDTSDKQKELIIFFGCSTMEI